MEIEDRRVEFDFEVDFSNGGGIQGQGFRLDVDGDDIDDAELAAYIVRDMRLLMVGEVRILNRRIIRERHKRASAAAGTRIDLSHVVEDGMIGTVQLCAKTGTYVDSPFQRYADGADLSELPLERLADLDAVVIYARERAVDRADLLPYRVAGRAVLVRTGWDRHWRTDAYLEGHPFLTEAAAVHLVEQGALLVGIDSLNIDDTATGERPVHSTLLAAGIPICEHLTNLGALPTEGFRFSAVPVMMKGLGTFPVRSYAVL